MIGSERVRAARKKQHLERLAAKKKGKRNSYAQYFSKMPGQVVKAEKQEKIREAKADLVVAAEDLQIAEIDGEGLLAAQEKATIAALVVQKLEAAERPQAAAVLTASGGK